jgi:hypothetical protein
MVPDFLHEAPPTDAGAAFIKESRMKFLHFQRHGVGRRTLGTHFLAGYRLDPCPDLSKLDASVQQPPFPCNDPLLFVIPKRSRISYFTALNSAIYVVLPKENHMQLTEAVTLDRKSGEAEGSAVRHSCAPAPTGPQPPPIITESSWKNQPPLCHSGFPETSCAFL